MASTKETSDDLWKRSNRGTLAGKVLQTISK